MRRIQALVNVDINIDSKQVEKVAFFALIFFMAFSAAYQVTV